MRAMHIAVVGAGTVGTNLARRFADLGHEVVFAARDPLSDKVTSARREVPEAQVCGLDELPYGADMVVLAVPFAGLADVLSPVGDLSATVVVDATNAVDVAMPDGCASIVDVIRRHHPEATVVKAFNTIGAEAYLEPSIDGHRLFLPVAGPEPAASTVADLAGDMGFDALVIGDAEQAVLLEGAARLWIHLAFACGLGRRFGFARLQRPG